MGSRLEPAVGRVLEEANAVLKEDKIAEALAIYAAAFEELSAKSDHFGASNVAHMAGVAEPNPGAKLRWNERALREADAVADRAVVATFYASLYNNLAVSYALLGDDDDAARCFRLAWTHTGALEPGPYAQQVKATIHRSFKELESRVPMRTREGPDADV